MRPKPNTTASRAQSARVEPESAGGARTSMRAAVLPYAPEVPHGDHGDGERDDRLDDGGRRRHDAQGGEHEGHRVRHRERRRREHHVAQAPRPHDQGEQEQDVVDAEQQVLGTEHEEVPEPLEHRLLRGERRSRAVERCAAALLIEVVLQERHRARHVRLGVREQPAPELVRRVGIAGLVEREGRIGHALALRHAEPTHGGRLRTPARRCGPRIDR